MIRVTFLEILEGTMTSFVIHSNIKLLINNSNLAPSNIVSINNTDS